MTTSLRTKAGADTHRSTCHTSPPISDVLFLTGPHFRRLIPITLLLYLINGSTDLPIHTSTIGNICDSPNDLLSKAQIQQLKILQIDAARKCPRLPKANEPRAYYIAVPRTIRIAKWTSCHHSGRWSRTFVVISRVQALSCQLAIVA